MSHFSIASTMLRALSALTVVGPRSRGPIAVTTASRAVDRGDDRRRVHDVRGDDLEAGADGIASRLGSRTTAVTSCPARSAWSTRDVPVPPVAPKIVSCMLSAFRRFFVVTERRDGGVET